MNFSSGLTKGKLIGQGFFGSVYEGLDEVHGKVAVKVLEPYPHEADSDWRTRREQLLSEAQNLREARHRNVVTVLYLVRSQHDGNLHMVTEFCDGGSLERLYKAGPVKISKTRKVVTDICLGLDALHTRGMLHRDIKPGNILFSDSRWKIADFGLVTNELILGYASDVGYMDHLAPEVHKDKVTSVRTDVWALGMTIYRLLHGEQFYNSAFSGKDIPDLVTSGGFARRLPWLPHIPKIWRKVIRKALHDDSSLRFDGVSDLSQAIGKISITPDWQCDFQQNLTSWTLHVKSRTVSVRWEVISSRKHIWIAESTGGSRKRKLGGSKTPQSRERALSEIEEFLLSY
jgi:serine/threonine protein kinase